MFPLVNGKDRDMCIRWLTFILIGFLSFSFAVGASEKMSAKDIKWLEGHSNVKAIGCDTYENSSYSVTERKDLKVKDSSFKNQRVFDKSKLICDLWSDTADISKPLLHVQEKAVIDGINVLIFQSDGSGTIGEGYNDKSAWNSSCKVDSMTDAVTCSVYQNNFYLFKTDSGYTVVIGSEHFPKTLSYLRVNKDKPLASGEDGVFSNNNSNQIIESLSEGGKVMIRFTKWPYENPIDEEVDIKYFNSAKKALDLIYSNHK